VSKVAHGEVLLEYRTPLFIGNGHGYRAQACGGEACDGTDRWHGWVEFIPLDGGSPVRTARETTQPNRKCTVYWSTGLSAVYLEGALERALRLMRVRPATDDTGSAPRNPPRIRHGVGPHTPRSLHATTLNPCLELTRADRTFLRTLSVAPA